MMKLVTLINSFKNIGLLANQTSYDFNEKMYLSEILGKNLKRIFVPEHGFFSELQDQVTLDDTSLYSFAHPEVEFVSIYGSNKEANLQFPKEYFDGLDAIVIDIQDVGVRYFTYITSVQYMLQSLSIYGKIIPIFIVDHPNPNIGRIEGSPMQAEYASFIGIEGLPHCYGLSFFELIKWMVDKNNFNSEIYLLDDAREIWIQPSPNIPTKDTCQIYRGQCLFEGTTFSEGRGTTLPFQLFGSPYLKYEYLEKIKKSVFEKTITIDSLHNNYELRPLKFIPTFHKHQNQVCNGFQLHVFDNRFHSLLFSLILLKEISQNFSLDEFYRKGSYEYGNDKTAIELLVGDAFLLEYLSSNILITTLCDYLYEKEKAWKEELNLF